MIIGLISDIHANILALEAVLEELKYKGATTIICLGDLVGYGPSPNETVSLIRKEGVMCTLGAADERIAFDFTRDQERRAGVADDILEWTKSVLEPNHIEYLRKLPVQQKLSTPAGRFRFFHGSPETPSVKLDLQKDPITLTRLLERNRCKILACGATHVPYVRKLNAGWVLNPGSVGLALNGEPGADYALLKFSEDRVDITMDKVEYDFAAVAFDIIAWGLPSLVADAVQQGRMPEEVE